MNILEYAKGVERLVDPMEVGKVLYLQTKMKHLPVFLQRKIVTIRMEPPSQVISNQIAGVGSDDPLSRLCIKPNCNPLPQGMRAASSVWL